MKSQICIFILAISFGLFSCKKNTTAPVISSDQQSLFFTKTIKTNISGIVLDMDSIPVANAMVSIEGNIVYSNAEGKFMFNKITTKQHATCIKVAANGFQKGIRTIQAQTSGNNYTMIKLWKRPAEIVFDASKDFQSSGAHQLHIPANSLVNKTTGVPYTGSAKAYILQMPADEKIYYTMPGGVLAKSTTGDPVMLKTFGMLDVELYDADGNALQIKQGAEADFKVPIHSSVLAKAPDVIPMWYLDETIGVWQQEGSAKKEGNEYKCVVKHFTVWNCDMGIPVSDSGLVVILIDSTSNQILVDYRIDLIDANNVTQTIYSTGLGASFLNPIAAGTYTVNVFFNCSSQIYSYVYTKPANISYAVCEIKIPSYLTNLLVLTPKAYDCNNNLCQNVLYGYRILAGPIVYNNIYLNGPASPLKYIKFSSCEGGTPFTLYSYDIAHFKKDSITDVFPNVSGTYTMTACTHEINRLIIVRHYGSNLDSIVLHEPKKLFDVTYNNGYTSINFGQGPTLDDQCYHRGLLSIIGNAAPGNHLIQQFNYSKGVIFEDPGHPLFCDFGFGSDSSQVPITILQNTLATNGVIEGEFHGKFLNPNIDTSSNNINIPPDSVSGYFYIH
jgi:hypothetical protein